MKIALYYHGLPPQTHNSSPIMRKMSAKSQCVCVGGASNKIPPVPLKTVRVIKNKQHLETSTAKRSPERCDNYMLS